MPRIKQLLAAGQVVRVFAAGQLLSPKLIEIVGEHGEFENSRCGGHRDHRTNLCRGQQALGCLFARSGLRGANARPGMPALRPCLRHPHGARGYPHGQRAVQGVFPGWLNLHSCAAFAAHCGGGGGCASRPEKRLCRELPILPSTPLLARR